MKRLAGGLVALALTGGGAAALAGPFMASYWNKQAGPCCGSCYSTLSVPNAVGPWGQPVPMAAPYTAQPPDGAAAARAMMAQSVPLDVIQQAGWQMNGGIPGAVGPGPLISPPGVPAAPVIPGPGRGMAGSPIQLTSGPMPAGPLPGGGPPGAVAAVGALTNPGGNPFPSCRTEIRFVGPSGMKISWYGIAVGGRGGLASNFIEAPGRYNFVQGAIYRLKLSDIVNRPGLELYPTLEVVPANAKTATFLAHSAVPVSFTEEDFEQVAAGNFVVKVIYLPDPRFQDLATIGVDEVVSSRLEPGVDPIAEACRRGSILAIVRVGNIDLEAPNTPAMDAPNPYAPAPKHAAGSPRPGTPMVPPGMVPPGPMNASSGAMPLGMPLPPAMQQQMPQVPPTMPGVPTNLPPPQGRPTGPVGQLPDPATIEQAKFAAQNRALTQAELAAQSASMPSAPVEKKGPLQRLFGGASDASASRR
jgi:hypothetical protein